MALTPEKICKTAQALGDQVGVSRYTISAIRKTGRALEDPLPNYATPADVRSWLKRHPTFVARNAFKKPAQIAPGSNPAPVAAGKSDGSPRPSAPHTPSPAAPAHPLAPSA